MRELRYLLALAMLAGGAPVLAQAPGYYAAVPVQAPSKPSLVTRETLWQVRGNAYVAARAADRDATLCAAVVKSAGALSSFTAGGKAFDAEQLAACNARAKAGHGGAAVAQAR